MDTIKSAVKKGLSATGFYRGRLAWDRWRHPGRRLLVLVYHNLMDVTDPDRSLAALFKVRPVLDVRWFERQMEHLSNSMRVVPLAQGVEELRFQGDEPVVSAAVTFDDAYLSFATLAQPILQRHGVPSTVFVATDFADERQPFWWDELTALVAAVRPGRERGRALFDAAGLVNRDVSDATSDEGAWRRQVLIALEEALFGTPTDRLHGILARLRDVAECGQVSVPDSLRVMSWDQMRTLRDLGTDFGSHTASHLNLSHASSEMAVADILRGCRRVDEELKQGTRMFAYPYGLDLEAFRSFRRVLQDASLDLARTMSPGVNEANVDPLLLTCGHLDSTHGPLLIDRAMRLSMYRHPRSVLRPASALARTRALHTPPAAHPSSLVSPGPPTHPRPLTTSERPMVSVVIPTFNSAAFVREALDSVTAQSWRDYEIIVVDDGSTDDTLEVVRQCRVPVKVLRQEHGGPAAARNTAIESSRGEYIAFLDSDDRWRPEKLKLQMEQFQRRPDLGLVMTGHAAFDDRGLRRARDGTNKRKRLLQGDRVRNIFESSGVATPSVMVTRRALDTVGLFDSSLIMSEDDNLWMRIAHRFDIDVVDEPLTEIRLRADSMTMDILRLKAAFERHLDLLHSRYPEIGQRVASLIPTRAAAFEYAAGRHYLSEACWPEAQRAFLRSVELAPLNGRYKMWRYVSMLPAPLLWLMRAMRGMRRMSGNG